MICSESCGTLACCSNCSWHHSSSRTAGVLKVTEHRSVKTWPICESVVITHIQVLNLSGVSADTGAWGSGCLLLLQFVCGYVSVAKTKKQAKWECIHVHEIAHRPQKWIPAVWWCDMYRERKKKNKTKLQFKSLVQAILIRIKGCFGSTWCRWIGEGAMQVCLPGLTAVHVDKGPAWSYTVSHSQRLAQGLACNKPFTNVCWVNKWMRKEVSVMKSEIKIDNCLKEEIQRESQGERRMFFSTDIFIFEYPYFSWKKNRGTFGTIPLSL